MPTHPLAFLHLSGTIYLALSLFSLPRRLWESQYPRQVQLITILLHELDNVNQNVQAPRVAKQLQVGFPLRTVSPVLLIPKYEPQLTTNLNRNKISTPRIIDLVGDYAGDELFILEGDSLLRRSFSDSQLDFDPGFQLLHATYIVERFLAQLHQRKCHFHVVFFSAHSEACIPPHTSSGNRSKYRVARETIIQHLARHMPKAIPSIQIRRFEMYDCKEFYDYLVASRAYFIMCHDGEVSKHNQSPVKGPESSEDLYVSDEQDDDSVWEDDEIPHVTRPETGVKGNNAAAASAAQFRSFQKTYLKVPTTELTQREWVSILTLSAAWDSGHQSGQDTDAMHALLLHAVILRDCHLCDRPCRSDIPLPVSIAYLELYNDLALTILQSPLWQEVFSNEEIVCDLADMIDGRILSAILNRSRESTMAMLNNHGVTKRYNLLVSVLNGICQAEILVYISPGNSVVAKYCQDQDHKQSAAHSDSKDSSSMSGSVMTFSNPVFDRHLSPISLKILSSAAANSSFSMSIPFEERKHWHSQRDLDPKRPAPMSWREQRRDQRFMRDITQYAISLTNATGGILQRESVVLKSKNEAKPKPANNHGKTDRPTALHPSAQLSEKQEKLLERQAEKWQTQRRILDKEPSHDKRYVKAKAYLEDLSEEKRGLVEAEVLTYLISTLIRLWRERCSGGEKAQAMAVVALIWHNILQIAKAQVGITQDIARCMLNTSTALGLPNVKLTPHDNRPLSFEFALRGVKSENLRTGLSPREFQLLHAGPFLDRNMDSAPDSRVRGFEPDRWQRDILDQIDARASLFVVAPTSAGKTFISFYAIKQILQNSDDDVLVYVAPTKALVNQVAAEIEARFTKNYKHAGKSVWAIHTRDTRINNPTKCQVLITVPHILQIMLLAPGHANSWSSRVKRIIFDEVHCIGQADDGVVWEQLLLLAQCPIIALSATVGNPEEFSSWLSMTQRANGLDLKTVEHKTRWSDLRKYTYHPPSKFHFDGFSKPINSRSLGLDDCPAMAFIHPVTGLVDRSRGIPEDLSLEPRDCLTLWQAMDKHQTNNFPLDPSLSPSAMLPELMTKADVSSFEAKLKTVLGTWMADYDSPFDTVVKELSESARSKNTAISQCSSFADRGISTSVGWDGLLETTLPLICALSEQDALPALFFNYDRGWCEKICMHVLIQLQEAEEAWKGSSRDWAKKLAGWENWKRSSSKRATRATSVNTMNMSRAEQTREAASEEPNRYASFDPHAPVPMFSLADEKKLSRSAFAEYATELKRFGVPHNFIDALRRGIGIHHAGMNRAYRKVCEILFRKGYLRVVIATGTLALGVNMPCKTVVFSGDSVFLTALNFRQSAGRAGRRGFDYLGNVVFQAIPDLKIRRLMSSKLPGLNGHFPITTSLVLRLCILLHESGQAPFAKNAIDSILSSPRIYLGGPESKHTVLHHLRFSIEYLRRNHLLDGTGAPLNFAGAISHLYYTENSSFALHALLKAGYFHKLSNHIDENPGRTLRTLMVVMAHLFGRQPLHTSVLERHYQRHKQSTSTVVLPSLPRNAARILCGHNRETLDIYSTYVATFVDQHLHEPDNRLPLTQLRQGGGTPISEITRDTILAQRAAQTPTQAMITSPFVALSNPDPAKNIADLCKAVRQGVWLEQSVIPHVPVESDGEAILKNAYLYDFFKHGNKRALETENMIRRGDLWFRLNDFSLVLATIVASLGSFLEIHAQSAMGEVPGLEVMGCGDLQEEEGGDDTADADGAPLPAMAKDSIGEMKSARRKFTSTSSGPSVEDEVPDSWEDAIQDGDDIKEGAGPATAPETFFSEYNQNAQDQRTKQAVAAFKRNELLRVLRMFQTLKTEFDDKFRKMWA
ncbi:putative DEAD/DEAH box helicase [Aspergillus homomorphus CBS 101889]|uniref:P-loop containing nucleoside triphosphate hydrolase protein n=1 Tax=Aspergillus homomorphus (strain CBS 101889) TaxID=1450537 RepID=A0A395HVG8_ASPHC|nr:P-loop containing nucleoside triphosphate hydrolase protein [Aspergillus homomorphus CBS 101889]RAL11807.1 P-loop containing nucleoside triphosphate hydrolase protein [Aspergillus homomorphus CBS 101889]